MDKETKDAWTKGKNLSPEALEKRRDINKKILKFFMLSLIISLVAIIVIATRGTKYIPKEKNIDVVRSESSGEIVQSFCYALQASSICANLNMRIDTEGKIEAKIGGKFRNQTSVYSSDCWAGLNKAFEEENKGLCRIAWEKYGCSGTEIPKLVQENPFKIKNGIFCNY